MTMLHPQWHSTDNDAQPVNVTVTAAQADVQRVRRFPAAIVGVVLFLAIGVLAFQGLSGMRGQLQNTDIIITIGEAALEPRVATIRPGQTIRWKNTSAIPHILTSDTLPTADGRPFATTAIFPADEYAYVLPASAQAGTYDYASGTSTAVMGQVIVAGSPMSTANTASRVSELTTQSTSSAAPVVPHISSMPTQQFVPQVQADQTIGIPQNPHTISSGDAPLPPRQQPSAVQATSITDHTPSTTAQTGMEMWTIAIVSVAALAGVFLRARARKG